MAAAAMDPGRMDPGRTDPGRTVLIIDDDAVIREVAKVALEVVGGWRVLAADSGREGLELATRDRPDAVLMDVMMPEFDGPSSASALAEDPRTHDIPVVFLTAKGHDLGLGADRVRPANCAGVIAKPFDPMTLADEIREMLGWQA